MEFYEEHPQNWRDCFAYIHANYGYDKYPGKLPYYSDIAVMILALLYGNGDFSGYHRYRYNVWMGYRL